jgi:hypothetical protein
MSSKRESGDGRRTLHMQAEAARQLRAKVKAFLGEDDPEMAHDAIEGETDFFETLDWVLEQNIADDALIDGLKAAMAKLKARCERIEKRQETRREALLTALITAGFESEKIVRPLATLRVAQKARQLEIINESQIPPRYFTVPDPTPDKKAILAALRAGEAIEGCSLDNGGAQLQIRTS